ncbi:MAG: hypothetical protein GMKNLPBB_00742 [Myxococcota bacterium]|nr:hypothetical protein [Myxococcota bacterium]
MFPAVKRGAIILTLASLLLAGGVGIFWKGAEIAQAPANAGSKAGRYAIFFTADMKGYIEPCGCNSNPLGGVEKLAAVVRKEREGLNGSLFLDAGESLFSNDSLPDTTRAQELAKAAVFGKTFASLGIAAMNVGQRELAHGSAWLASWSEKYGVPVVSDTFTRGGERPFARPGLIGMGPLRVGVIAVSDAVDEKLARTSDGDRDEAVGEPAAATAAKARLAQLRKDGADIIVLLSNLGPGRTADLIAKLPRGVTFAIASGRDNDKGKQGGEESTVVRAGDVPVYAPHTQGRALGRVDLVFVEGGSSLVRVDGPGDFELKNSVLIQNIERHRIDLERLKREKTLNPARIELVEKKLAALRAERDTLVSQKVEPPPGKHHFFHRFTPIEKKLPDDPAIREIMNQYNAELAKLNVPFYKDRRPPPVAEGKPHYTGGAACIGCHMDAYNVWKGHKHSLAYETLVNKNKQYDVSCIGCHVVGWEQPGGLANLTPNEGFQDVNCENCHGPGSQHAAAPSKSNIQRKVPEAICLRCHQPEHDDRFDYQKDLLHVLGPGHGLPKEAAPPGASATGAGQGSPKTRGAP